MDVNLKKYPLRDYKCMWSEMHNIVKDYAIRLADECGLILVDLISKTPNRPQKEMENSFYQCKNVFNSFNVRSGVSVPEKIILVDDIVDSRWTLTVCGYKLAQKGCKEVYPFALADSGGSGGDTNE